MWQNERLCLFDAQTKITICLVDCLAAAQTLAQAHLCGSTASHYLAQALASVSLLGAETSQNEETVTWRLDCPGPLGGFLVEATAQGTLRGYVKKKVLNDFDGQTSLKDRTILGETGRFEVIRSIPGAILSSGAVSCALEKKDAVAQGFNAYFEQSLQRHVKGTILASSSEEGAVLIARAMCLECAPDGDQTAFQEKCAVLSPRLLTHASVSSLMKRLALPHAEVRMRTPLAFACRCSAERAQAMLAALPPGEGLPAGQGIDVICHMCGRMWHVQG